MRRASAASGLASVTVLVDKVTMAAQFACGRLCPGAVQGFEHEAGEATEQRSQAHACRSLARDVSCHWS